MSDAASRPFGHDTVTIPCVVVPEGEAGAAGLPQGLPFGPDTLTLPAVIVPEGSDAPPPGYPYICLGKIELPAGWGGARAPAGSWRGAGDPAAGAADRAAAWSGRDGLSGNQDGPPDEPRAAAPPTATLAQVGADPVRTALAAWRALDTLSPPRQPAAPHSAGGSKQGAIQSDPGPGGHFLGPGLIS
jgi:hypothetical protein